MNSNIILIGMPGSGKSTCGVVSAKMLLKNFYDTDLLIQNLEGKSLQEIIDKNGVEYFAKAEERAILSLDIKGTVIATGGSVVYSDKAMEHLKSLMATVPHMLLSLRPFPNQPYGSIMVVIHRIRPATIPRTTRTGLSIVWPKYIS